MPEDLIRSEYSLKSRARRASGNTSMPDDVAGMSSFTTTVRPSKYSFNAASFCADAGRAASAAETATSSRNQCFMDLLTRDEWCDERVSRRGGNLNQWFVQVSAFAVGTLPRLGELGFLEGEAGEVSRLQRHSPVRTTDSDCRRG